MLAWQIRDMVRLWQARTKARTFADALASWESEHWWRRPEDLDEAIIVLMQCLNRGLSAYHVRLYPKDDVLFTDLYPALCLLIYNDVAGANRIESVKTAGDSSRSSRVAPSSGGIAHRPDTARLTVRNTRPRRIGALGARGKRLDQAGLSINEIAQKMTENRGALANAIKPEQVERY